MGSPSDGEDAGRDKGGRGAARAVKEIGRMTAARAQQLLQTQEEQTREILKLQRMNKKLKGAEDRYRSLSVREGVHQDRATWGRS